MTLLKNPEQYYWRTDFDLGRTVYALISNDPDAPSIHDPMIGVMESTALAEDVVNTHNGALQRYGRKYPQRLKREDLPK